MNPKTIKVKTLAKGELFACDNLSINGTLLDIPSLKQKTQFQSSATSPNETDFIGTITINSLTALATTLTAYFLKTASITPTLTFVTISGNFANSITPNSATAGSVTCSTKLTVNNATTFSTTILRVLRTLVASNTEIGLTVGTNVNFNAAKFTFRYVSTGTPNTSNVCTFGISTSSGLQVWSNMTLITNSLKIGDPGEFIKPNYTQFSNVTNNANVSSVYGLTSGPAFTAPIEICINLTEFVFPNSGELYIQFSNNSSFTQLFTYSGITRNSTDLGIGTPSYLFLPPVGTTTAKANRGWNEDVQGVPVFIGRYTDTTGTSRVLTSLALKMYRFAETTVQPATWIITFQGYINSYTMGPSSPPYIIGCGSMTGTVSTYTPQFFRLKMKDTKTFTNGGDTNKLKCQWFVS